MRFLTYPPSSLLAWAAGRSQPIEQGAGIGPAPLPYRTNFRLEEGLGPSGVGMGYRISSFSGWFWDLLYIHSLDLFTKRHQTRSLASCKGKRLFHRRRANTEKALRLVFASVGSLTEGTLFRDSPAVQSNHCGEILTSSAQDGSNTDVKSKSECKP